MNNKKSFFRLDLNAYKETKWPIIAGVVFSVFFWGIVLNLIVYPSKWVLPILKPIITGTHQLVNGTFIGYLLLFIVIVYPIIFYIGKVNKKDVGIEWKLLPQALIVVSVFWVAAQTIGLVFTLVSGGSLSFTTYWTSAGLTAGLGVYISQFFGCAPWEEIVFRGFLLLQVFLKLKKQNLQFHPLFRLIIALIISQGIFALFHIPNQIYNGASSADMIFTLSKIFLLGIIISLIYLRTKNLFIAMGIHALWNLPNLFVSDNIGGFIAVILALVLLVGWSLFSKANPVKISKQADIIA